MRARPAPSAAPGCAGRRRRDPTTVEGVEPAPGKSYASGACRPAPTDYGGRPVLMLNSGWAVGDDGALQWLLLRRAGRSWHPRRYHVQRDAILRSIVELCGGVDPRVVETIGGWSAFYQPSDHATGRANG